MCSGVCGLAFRQAGRVFPWLAVLGVVVACGTEPLPPRALSEARSGYAFLSSQEQQLQDDDFGNPGLLWVDQGARLFADVPASGEPACSGCHSLDNASFRTSAARYPRYSNELARLVNLEQRINACRSTHQGQTPLPYESEPLLSLTAYLARQASGTPIAVAPDRHTRAAFDRGRAYFYTRRGQLNLACHHCHEQHFGRMLRGDRLSQGQPTGYPAYKLEWQTLGSLHRRLRDCNVGVRAEPLPYGDPIYVSLELFLAWRASGLLIDTPAVRR